MLLNKEYVIGSLTGAMMRAKVLLIVRSWNDLLQQAPFA
jgi:hypothetical protein